MSEPLDARFARIRAFYRRHEAGILANLDDWYGDPYLWDSEGRIDLTPIEWRFCTTYVLPILKG